MAKILITGSQGTLGKELFKELELRGHEVWGCDLHHGERREIRADVAESRQIQKVFEKVQPDIVFHFAAEFGRHNGEEYFEQLWKTNCIGTRNVIEQCLKYGTHLVFSSSSEAYGSLADHGTLYESALEARVPAFHNEYALTKYTNEHQIKIAIKRGLKATVLRFFNVYGPGEFYNDYRSVISLFVYRALKNLPITVYKNTHRSFLYIDDWTNAVANISDRLDSLPNGAVFNIGSDEVVDLGTLLDIVVEYTGTKSEITVLDKESNNIADKHPYIDKSKHQLGLKELIDLRHGLKKTVDWMRDVYA